MVKMIMHITILVLIETLVAFGLSHERPQLPQIPENKETPSGIRLAYLSPSSVSVGWSTYEKIDKPCVSYGKNSRNLSRTACGSPAKTYGTSRVWFNTVALTDLEPAANYYYQIHATNGTSVKKFKSVMAAGDKSAFSFAFLADLGLYGEYGYEIGSANKDVPRNDKNHDTVYSLERLIDRYDFIMHPGDYAYADDWYENCPNIKNVLNASVVQGTSYEAVLEWYFRQISDVSSVKPWMIGPGNHEASCVEIPFVNKLCPEGQHNFTDIRVRYSDTHPKGFKSVSRNQTAVEQNKKARTLSYPPLWYSFDYGSVHFIMTNSETDFEHAPDLPLDDGGWYYDLDAGPFGYKNQQIDWLVADLESVDRRVTPWVIVMSHRPWYTTGTDICSPCQNAFEDIFYKYGVDLVAMGHEHNTQRYAPLYKGNIDTNLYQDPKYPAYIVIGGAGNIEGLTKIEDPKPNGYIYGNSDDFMWSIVHVEDDNNIVIDFIRSGDSKVVDSTRLYKSHKEAIVRNA